MLQSNKTHSYFSGTKINGRSSGLHLLKANLSLFSRLSNASAEWKIDLDAFFPHETHSFPSSLASGKEQIYHSAKSDIIHYLEKDTETLTDRIIDNDINMAVWYKMVGNLFIS